MKDDLKAEDAHKRLATQTAQKASNKAEMDSAEEKGLFRQTDKGLQTAFNRSEMRYRRLFETAYDGILILDFESGKVIDANPYILNMLGIDLKTSIGKELWEIGIFSDIKASKEAFTVLKAVGYIRYEDLPLETPDGVRHEVEFISNAYMDGTDQVIQCNIRDISERIISEELLALEKIHSDKIIIDARDAFISIDSEGNILEWNPSAVKLFGFSRKSVVGKNLADLIIPSEHKKSHTAGMKNYFELGTHKVLNKHVEITAVHKSGKVIPVELSIVPEGKGRETVFNAFIRDLTDRNKTKDLVVKSNELLKKSLLGTVDVISKMMELRDPYTSGHQSRVSEISVLIAQTMGLDKDQVEGIRIGAIIHDIGKIKTPSELLSKPRKLSDIEYQLIKEHAKSGYNLLKDVEFPWPIANIAHQHHERIDGSGYPQGLKGNEICLEAKIVAVADVVEAMGSHRPYRSALGVEAAMIEIYSHKNTFYDKDVVKACMKVFSEKKYTL